MIIYLDESKKINKGKKGQYIFGGLVTTYKSCKIDKIYSEFLEYSGIKYKGELKSTDRFYKDKIYGFYDFLDKKGYMNNIEFCGIYIDEYKENGDNYIEMLSILTKFIIEKNKFNNNSLSKINIMSDIIKLDKKENYINKILNLNLSKLKKKLYIKNIQLDFYNSKNYGGIKFSDFIVGILRQKYINNKEELPYNFIEYFINKEIKIIKILNK